MYDTPAPALRPLQTSSATLTLAHVDAETGFSGGEVQVFLLMEGLRARGHRNLLFCPPGSRSEARAKERGIETRAVGMANDLDLGAVLELARGFKQASVDLVHLHTGRATWLGGVAAQLARVPAVSTRRMDRAVKRGWRTAWIYGSCVRRAVAISPSVRVALEDGGVPAERTALIASAVDPGALRPARPREAVRSELSAAPGDVVLLALASLVPRKGIDVLLEALASIERAPATDLGPDLGIELGPVLWIAGEGPERGALEARAVALGLERRARFLGRRDDAADLLAACDVLVLPSRREGLGVAALEAMAAGRPVVASRVGGLADLVVDGRTGLLVPPGDAAALAGALQRLVGDPALRERLGAAGPARVAEGFLAGQMVDAYERLYAEVLSEESPP